MTEEQAALIARIEAATEADQWLNHNIATGVGWKKKPSGHGWSAPDNDKYHADYPSFTKSLDAAMSLIPADYWWGIIMRSAENSGFSAAVLPPDTAMVWHVGATPALALCLAALRARWAS